MLQDIQTYMATHGTVSVKDLSLRFHTDIQALKPMLQRLIRKGRIQLLPTAAKCTGCTSCDLSSLECYTWLGKSL